MSPGAGEDREGRACPGPPRCKLARGANVVIQKNWQELIKPNKLEVTPGHDPKRIATVVAEPLERGFGTTLGNSLRRVLLPRSRARPSPRSRSTACCTSSRRSRRARGRHRHRPQHQDDRDPLVERHPQAHDPAQDRPGLVTAGDIATIGDVQILNPDLVLCTLDDGAEIRMEFTVSAGKGYVPAERNRPEDAPIGLIRSMRCSRRSPRCPTASRTPARARISTRTS